MLHIVHGLGGSVNRNDKSGNDDIFKSPEQLDSYSRNPTRREFSDTSNQRPKFLSQVPDIPLPRGDQSLNLSLDIAG